MNKKGEKGIMSGGDMLTWELVINKSLSLMSNAEKNQGVVSINAKRGEC